MKQAVVVVELSAECAEAMTDEELPFGSCVPSGLMDENASRGDRPAEAARIYPSKTLGMCAASSDEGCRLHSREFAVWGHAHHVRLDIRRAARSRCQVLPIDS